jgi:hypothetical protein
MWIFLSFLEQNEIKVNVKIWLQWNKPFSIWVMKTFCFWPWRPSRRENSLFPRLPRQLVEPDETTLRSAEQILSARQTQKAKQRGSWSKTVPVPSKDVHFVSEYQALNWFGFPYPSRCTKTTKCYAEIFMSIIIRYLQINHYQLSHKAGWMFWAGWDDFWLQSLELVQNKAYQPM